METWSRLPMELRMLVLSLLPLQVLVSLRRVCKEWKRLQLDPAFASLQRLRCRQKGGFLGAKQGGKLYYLRHDNKWLELPGLQLALGRCWFEDASDNLTLWSVLNKQFYVFNPASGRGEELPQPTIPALVQWPLWHKLQGIHVDPSSSKYKVVCACLDTGRACIYESASGAWREISAPAAAGIPDNIKHAGGKIIWTLDTRVLLQFDFESETWVSKALDANRNWMYGSIGDESNESGIEVTAENDKVRVTCGEGDPGVIPCSSRKDNHSVAIQGKRVLVIPDTSSSTCFVYDAKKMLHHRIDAPCPLKCAHAFKLGL